MGDWLNKHGMPRKKGYNAVVKKNEVYMHVKIWNSLLKIICEKRSKKQDNVKVLPSLVYRVRALFGKIHLKMLTMIDFGKDSTESRVQGDLLSSVCPFVLFEFCNHVHILHF
jgi:hypothetical protein